MSNEIPMAGIRSSGQCLDLGGDPDFGDRGLDWKMAGPLLDGADDDEEKTTKD